MKYELQNHVKCVIKKCEYDTFTLSFAVDRDWADRLKSALRDVATSAHCFAAQSADGVESARVAFDVTFTADKGNGMKMTPSVIKSLGFSLQGHGCISMPLRTQLARDAERAPTPPGVRRI